MIGSSRLPRRHTTLLNVTDPNAHQNNVIKEPTDQSNDQAVLAQAITVMSPEDQQNVLYQKQQQQQAAHQLLFDGKNQIDNNSPDRLISAPLLPKPELKNQPLSSPPVLSEVQSPKAGRPSSIDSPKSLSIHNQNQAAPGAVKKQLRQPNVVQVTFPSNKGQKQTSGRKVSSKACQIGPNTNLIATATQEADKNNQPAPESHRSHAQVQTVAPNFGNIDPNDLTAFNFGNNLNMTQVVAPPIGQIVVAPIDSIPQEQQQYFHKPLLQVNNNSVTINNLNMNSLPGPDILSQTLVSSGRVPLQPEASQRQVSKIITTAKVTNNDASSARARTGSIRASPKSSGSCHFFKPQPAQKILIEQRRHRSRAPPCEQKLKNNRQMKQQQQRQQNQQHGATSQEIRIQAEATNKMDSSWLQLNSNIDSGQIMASSFPVSATNKNAPNAFYLKGTKAQISSSASGKFTQLKQRQIKFDAPRQVKNHNLMSSLVYRQQLQQQRQEKQKQKQLSNRHQNRNGQGQLTSQKQKSLTKQLEKTMMVEQANQTSRNDNNGTPDNIFTKGTSQNTGQSFMQLDNNVGVQVQLSHQSKQNSGEHQMLNRDMAIRNAAAMYQEDGVIDSLGGSGLPDFSQILGGVPRKNTSPSPSSPTTAQQQQMTTQAMQQEMASVLPAGMIDQESKIVIVRSQTGSQDSQGSRSKNEQNSQEDCQNAHKITSQDNLVQQQGLVNLQQHFTKYDTRGQIDKNNNRRQIKRDAYVSEGSQASQSHWPQKYNSQRPGTSGLVTTQLKSNQQVMMSPQKNKVQSRQSIGMGVAASYNPYNTYQESQRKPQTAAGNARNAIKEVLSSGSLMTKPTNNTLSQILGIAPQMPPNSFSPRTMSPADEAQEVEQQDELHQNKRFTSGLSYQQPNMTISQAQAKEFNLMRSRIKSQGGPRRRYLNQRQNIYNLMASGLKKSTISSSGQHREFDSDNTTSRHFMVNNEQQSMRNLGSIQPSQQYKDQQNLQQPQHLQQEQQLQYRTQQLLQQKTASKGYYRNSLNANFISYEDHQEVDGGDAGSQSCFNEATQQQKLTPRTLLHLQQQEDSSEANILQPLLEMQSLQRMDLPNMMSEEQAHFMMEKTMKTEYLKQLDKFQRMHVRRTQGARLCSTQRCGATLKAAASQDFSCPDEWIKERVQTSEGAIVEPNFTIVRDKKTIADFVKSSQSMTLQVPVQKSAFIMQLNEDPTMPYSRARNRKVNEETLQCNDETYALIDQHIARLTSREKPSTIKQMFKTSRSPNKNDSHFKVGELLSAHKTSQKVSQDAIVNSASVKQFQAFDVEEQEQQVPSPVRKKIKILKLDASQGTTGQGGYETGGSFDHLENLRMSTKLLANDQKTASHQQSNTKTNNVQKNSDLPTSGFQGGSIQETSQQDDQVQMMAIGGSAAASLQQRDSMKILDTNTVAITKNSEMIITLQQQKKLEMESGDFHVKMKRQPLSPQPFDTHSVMLTTNKEGERKKVEAGNNHPVHVQQQNNNNNNNQQSQDVAVEIPHLQQQSATHHEATGLVSSSGAHVGQSVAHLPTRGQPGHVIRASLHGGASYQQQQYLQQQQQYQQQQQQVEDQAIDSTGQLVITNLNIQPRTQIRLKSSNQGLSQNALVQSSQQSKNGLNKQSTPRLTLDGQQEQVINSVPTMFKEAAVSSFQPKKVMRKHMDQLAVNEKKLNQQSEREKSFKVSGIKMFNTELNSQSAAQSHRNNSTTSRNVNKVSDMMVRQNIERRSNDEMLLLQGNQIHQEKTNKNNNNSSQQQQPLNSNNNDQEEEKLVTIAHDNTMHTQQDKIDSYDGCSTEIKSPSLHPRSQNVSPTLPQKIKSQRSESKIPSMELERAKTSFQS